MENNNEFSNYDHKGYRNDVKRDSEYFIEVIENNDIEGFCFNGVGKREGKVQLGEEIELYIGFLQRDFIDDKLNRIIFLTKKESSYYTNALFLKKYITKIFNNLRNNKAMYEVYETDEEKNKFKSILGIYLYGGYRNLILEIPDEELSEEGKRYNEEQNLKYKKQKREKLELERQKKEEKRQFEDGLKEDVQYLIENNVNIPNEVSICYWCDPDEKQYKETINKGLPVTIKVCEKHRKEKTSNKNIKEELYYMLHFGEQSDNNKS